MIFLKNFPPTWKNKEVYEFCKAYGEIEIEKGEDGKPRKDEDGNTIHKVYCEINSKTFEHFAKIVYCRTSEAKQAIQALNNQKVDGNQLNASEVIPIYDQKQEEQNTFLRRGVYVTDVPEDVTDAQELISIFEGFGKVTTARIIMKETGKDENGNKILKSKGQAFVLFET